jgi:hypothetical protein
LFSDFEAFSAFSVKCQIIFCANALDSVFFF